MSSSAPKTLLAKGLLAILGTWVVVAQENYRSKLNRIVLYQVTDTLGFGLKYPYTTGRNGLTATKSFTQEFDLSLAQRADQNWWGITPVTDAQDLQRLRALYHYAVCGDWNELVVQWRDTGVDLEAPHRSTLLNPPKSTNQVAAPDKPGASRENANKADASPFNPKSIVPAQPGVKPKAGGGGAGGVPGGSSGADTQYFVKLARNLYKLKGVRWLYWNGTPSDNPVFIEKCPALAQPTVPPYAVSLGVYGGRELWTSDPELFSDFILAVLASIPNTVGYPGSTPKATLTPLSVNVH